MQIFFHLSIKFLFEKNLVPTPPQEVALAIIQTVGKTLILLCYKFKPDSTSLE